MSRPKYCDDMECFACAPGRLKDAEEARKPKSPWQPIETAPKDGTRFLVAWTGGAGDIDYDACSYREGVFATRLGYGCRVVFTHWMPIPPLLEGK